MKLFLGEAQTSHFCGRETLRPPRNRLTKSLVALSLATALTVLPFPSATGLNLVFGTNTAAAQSTDKRNFKKMERIVKRAERQLKSIDRDVNRMESDVSKIRAAHLARTEEKLKEINEDLSGINDGFEGLADVQEIYSSYAARLEILKSARDSDSGDVNASEASRDINPADQKRIKSQISRLEKGIEGAERALTRFLDEPSLTSGRLEGVAKDRIASARERLSDLNEIAPAEAAKLDLQLTAMSSRFEARAAENAAFSGNRDAAAKKLEEMMASGALEAQLDVVNAIQEQSTQFENLAWDSHIFLDNQNTSVITQAAETWPDVTASFQDYMAENADIMGLGGALPTLSLILQKNLGNASKNLENLAETLPQLYETKAQAIIELGQKIVADQNIRQFDSRQAGGQSVAKELFWLKNWLVFYRSLPSAVSSTEATLQSQYEQTISKIDDLKNTVRDDIIAQNSLDPDFYAGSDREEILKLVEAGWRTIHGDTPILEIRIPSGQWSRTIGKRWDKIDRMFVLVDFSNIDAFVVEEPKGDIVTFWRVGVQMRHLEQDALISDPASRNRHAPKPDQQMLADKL